MSDTPAHPSVNENLRRLPGIDILVSALRDDPRLSGVPTALITRIARQTVADLRESVLKDQIPDAQAALAQDAILESVRQAVAKALRHRLRRTVNAAGVVVHTNLGRSLLADAAVDRLCEVARRYSNLEYDLERGRRGSRYMAVHDLLCEITGAEAAMVVNNNAAAVLLCLETMAAGRPVVVSRGELVEIGGAFRIPDVMAKSGAILSEVGTTNRTHPRDYIQAITADTALLLKVHTSNYALVGFTAEVCLADLVALGRTHGIPVMNDLGSGNFIDLEAYGLPGEPTVQAAVATGVDLVTFSGDKLLGGPQAGIILGRADCIERLRANPLNRALRIDKLTLAALEGTLRLYRDPRTAVDQIPTLRMLTDPPDTIARRAEMLAESLMALECADLEISLHQGVSKAGGGALPLLDLPSRLVGVRVAGLSAEALEHRMRANDPPIIGRIENDLFLMDVRTVSDDEMPIITAALKTLLERHGK